MGRPISVFLVAAFLRRRTLSEASLLFLANAVDARFGEGAYARFMADLRPTLLLMSFALVSGGVGLVVAYAGPTTAASGAKLISGFFFSGGLGLLVAYLLSIRFPPTLR